MHVIFFIDLNFLDDDLFAQRTITNYFLL
jgi:hypothetical protein